MKALSPHSHPSDLGSLCVGQRSCSLEGWGGGAGALAEAEGLHQNCSVPQSSVSRIPVPGLHPTPDLAGEEGAAAVIHTCAQTMGQQSSESH